MTQPCRSMCLLQHRGLVLCVFIMRGDGRTNLKLQIKQWGWGGQVVRADRLSTDRSWDKQRVIDQ